MSISKNEYAGRDTSMRRNSFKFIFYLKRVRLITLKNYNQGVHVPSEYNNVRELQSLQLYNIVQNRIRFMIYTPLVYYQK